jgi:formylglycine-generating enzyme required for sulfatase activity
MNELFRKTLLCVLTLATGVALLLPVSALADKGMLRIVTEPGDAKILFNGKMKGNSPSEPGQSFAIKLDEGEYVVQAIKSSDGLKEHFGEKKVFVADDTASTLTIKMEERVSQAAKSAMDAYVPNPEMVAVKTGKFRMGCLASDKKCDDDEKPVLDMNVPAFEIGKYEVTFEMWDACYAQGGCKQYPDDKGWGRGKRPVIYVSWDDIQEFLVWINKKTGKTYRLPTEPEWEYAARAGTTTGYSWGDEVGKNKANCDGCGSQWDIKQTAPVGSFAANPWGIHDMHGNVWEWCSGCKWAYKDSTADTNAGDWKNSKSGKCESVGRVVRGGSWNYYPKDMRAADRGIDSPEVRDAYFVGFRLARTN